LSFDPDQQSWKYDLDDPRCHSAGAHWQGLDWQEKVTDEEYLAGSFAGADDDRSVSTVQRQQCQRSHATDCG
jgi:hypothetical protein